MPIVIQVGIKDRGRIAHCLESIITPKPTTALDSPATKCHPPCMEDILQWCGEMERVTFAAGDMLFVEGEKSGMLYILISGGVEVIKGESPITVVREPGAVFGELSILLDQPHAASVEAVEETMCFMTRGGREFLEQHPKIMLSVAELLAVRLKGMIGYLADLKAQYEDRSDHLGMVDELLLNLAHRTPKKPR